MRTARLLALLAAMLMLAVGAGSAQSADTAPTGLHGFLLRADEPQKTSFSRTPSFAWNPVPGALHYEFQLSLSDSFRDNSVIYADDQALTPVEAPPITLPWITGSPHALYARVRAMMPDGATPWSTNFGFDMVPPAPPAPLSSYPGLLRWTPVEGAAGYQIWLLDAHKMEYSTTNTLDERDFYTFHQSAKWIGTVRWRIRALRDDATVGGGTRLNSIPAVTYGAWSPIYSSTNPAFNTPVANGDPAICPSTTPSCIKLFGTVSDIFSDGSPGSPAHRLMPGFLWTGNQTIDGKTVELYRVYVFTDKQCLNTVYTSAVIGSPAYAPRPFGPLALPSTAAGEASARSAYLPDGTEPASFSYDGATVKTTESASDAAPTTSIPGAPGDSSSTSTGPGSSPSSSSSSSSSSSTGSSGSGLTVTGRTGAPTDLWDTSWPSSGYYWTVVGVAAGSTGALSTSVGQAGAKAADTTLPLTDTTGLNPGDVITIGSGPTQETGTITAVSGNTVTLAVGLKFGHGFGEAVGRSSGGFEYQDLELPQDVCAAGRVMRFGKESEPSLVASGQLFATGLSSDGRLTSAVHTTSFYGQPLVSWTPALGAEVYEVQWSKTQYPFNPQPSPTGTLGLMTGATSVVLPVGPGTWWYRVRGFDYSLPTGAQQMSWSDPAKLVVAAPKFKLVGSPPARTKVAATKTTASGLRSLAGPGFTMGVPNGWTHRTLKDSVASFMYVNRTTGTNVVEVSASGRGTRSMTQWEADLKAELASAAHVTPSAALVTLAAGKAVKLTVSRVIGGAKIVQVQYIVDGGATAYGFTFTTTAARYTADAPTFAKMIASLKLTA
jgi:hypothetical protein